MAVEKKLYGKSLARPIGPGLSTAMEETFQKETGQPYPFSYEKDGRLAKDLLKLYSPETLQEITRDFFKDEWCKGKGFDFGLFRKQVGRLLSLKGTNPLEQAKRELRAK